MAARPLKRTSSYHQTLTSQAPIKQPETPFDNMLSLILMHTTPPQLTPSSAALINKPLAHHPTDRPRGLILSQELSKLTNPPLSPPSSHLGTSQHSKQRPFHTHLALTWMRTRVKARRHLSHFHALNPAHGSCPCPCCPGPAPLPIADPGRPPFGSPV